MDRATLLQKRRCYQNGCREPECREAHNAYKRERRSVKPETWQRGLDGCIIDPLTRRDVSDLIDDIARCLHPGSHR